MSTAPAVTNWKPIWLEWLREWSSTSASVHTATNYSRCVATLTVSQQVFTDPSELRDLKYFGEKTMHAIRRATLKYCKEKGVSIPPSLAENGSGGDTTPSGGTKAGRTASSIQFISPTSLANGAEASSKPTKATKAKAPRRFVPKFRSGGYALVVALYKYQRGDGQGIGKSDLIRLAKNFSDTPFEVHSNNINGFYGAWSSMKTLVKNNLVYQTASRNAHYMLTPEGREVAEALLKVTKENAASEHIVPQQNSSSPLGIRSPLGNIASNTPKQSHRSTTAAAGSSIFRSSSPIRRDDSVFRTPVFSGTTRTSGSSPMSGHITPVNLTSASPVNSTNKFKAAKWPAGSFRIKLLLDNREVASFDDRSYFAAELRKYGIAVEVMALDVGDMVWIAENKKTNQRAILDYIAERKRLDDLVGSMRDGRLKEQKHRLKRSTLGHVFYLVEEPHGMSRSQFHGSQSKSIMTVMSQTVVSDKFHLVRTFSAQETAKCLAHLSWSIEERYLSQPLSVIWPNISSFRESMAVSRSHVSVDPSYVGIDFDSFGASVSKSGNLTVKDVYIRMLMCVKGVTREKAHAIQKLYPTPADLFDAYESCSSITQKAELLSNATASNIAVKKIGKKLSETIYETWGDPSVTGLA